MGIDIKSRTATYLAGIIAVLISKMGEVGHVGGTDIPSCSKTFRNFELGAKSVAPDFKVRLIYVGS